MSDIFYTLFKRLRKLLTLFSLFKFFNNNFLFSVIFLIINLFLNNLLFEILDLIEPSYKTILEKFFYICCDNFNAVVCVINFAVI